ncbi:hypothetical protein TNCV_2163901 [Trichonephila clavipes]|nr:hypothetical protein TNCV_2163901 [Trichonephila clavipes]
MSVAGRLIELLSISIKASASDGTERSAMCQRARSPKQQMPVCQKRPREMSRLTSVLRIGIHRPCSSDRFQECSFVINCLLQIPARS